VFTGDRTFAGPNPPTGALVHYYLGSAPNSDVNIKVLDREGRAVRTLTSAARQAGVNRAVWDLRYDPPVTPPAAQPAGGRGPSAGSAGSPPAGPGQAAGGGGRFGGAGGPPVVPGEYTVVLNVGGHELRKPVNVAIDARIKVSEGALATQTQALLMLRDMTSRVNEIIDRADQLTTQLTALANELKRPSPGSAQGAGGESGALKVVNQALERVTRLREPLTRKVPGLSYRSPAGVRDRIIALSGNIGGYLSAPTAAQLERLKELQGESDTATAELRDILAKTVPEVNAQVSGRPRIAVPPIR
jgi:ribosomal protein S7